VLDFANVYPSVLNWGVVGLMAITFIALAKYVLALFPIPGVTEIVTSI
jgi:hypothetical protein